MEYVKHCLVCDKEYTTSKRTQIYCSRKCQMQSMRKDKASGICLFCGKHFTAKRHDSIGKYCSHQCQINDLHQQKLQRIQEKEEQKKLEEQNRINQTRINEFINVSSHLKKCKRCGKIFVSSYGKEYCSEECRRKAANSRHDKSRSKDKRLKQCDVRDYSISIHKVYEKYHGICQICGEELSFDCDCNDDVHPSIDHIIPIAKGGNHTWDNVQLLCRRCNYLKRDKILG